MSLLLYTIRLMQSFCFRITRLKIKSLIILPISLASFIVSAQPTLLLNTTGQPPLNTKEHTGFMDEVAREAMRRIDYKLVIDSIPAERALLLANKGVIDGEMSRIKNLDKIYTNLIRVPEKIMDWEFVVFSKKQINLSQGWDSLKGKDIAFIRGWKVLENNVPEQATITKVENSTQLFTLLDKNRVDYVAYEKWGGKYLINQLRLNNVTLGNPPLEKKGMFIYLHKKNSHLVPKLSAALIEMKADGSYQRLVEKHLTPLLK